MTVDKMKQALDMLKDARRGVWDEDNSDEAIDIREVKYEQLDKIMHSLGLAIKTIEVAEEKQ